MELRRGDQRAVIVEVGGGIRRYQVGSWHVLDGYGAAEMCSGARGQLLLPWPNRIRGGRYSFGGATRQLPLTEPEGGTAIHGLVRWSSWALAAPAADRAVATHVLRPQPGYPHTLGLEVTYQLSSRGLEVELAATNLGGTPLPLGAGQHPYLSVGRGPVDGWILQVRARRVLDLDLTALDLESAPGGDDRDFSSPRRIGGVRLDTCFADLDRDRSGIATVRLSDESGDRGVDLWMDAAFGYVMVYTGDTLEPDQRRRALAVEPMTCPPDAFNSGEAVIVLGPGEGVRARWGITPRPG